MKLILIILCLCANLAICAEDWERPIKCFVGSTNVRNQWRVQECPSYSTYCVKVQIGSINFE